MSRILSLFLFSSLLLGASQSVIAQVTIAPTHMFIDDGNRFGTYMVINGSNDPQEIAINFFFGYNQGDAEGNRPAITNDSSMAEKYSITDYIRAFPQNFTLQPNQRQIVRIRIQPPNDLPDGMYWARIETSSSPETPPIEIQSTETVSAQVGINLKQITAIYYKKGTLSTGLTIQHIRTNITENQELEVFTSLVRTGNAPFIGSVTHRLLNESGEEIRQRRSSTTIFVDEIRRYTIDLTDVPSGTYSLQVTFESQRSDISQNDLIQTDPISSTTSITIP